MSGVFKGIEAMLAPEKFVAWLAQNRQSDKLGHTYCYHPRSDSHSKALSMFIWEDLQSRCPVIKRDHDEKLIDSAINFRHHWPNTFKDKTIDLAIGTISPMGMIQDVRVSCELKAVMTEHSKSKPRVFDELSSSNQIVHAADPLAIAAGVTVVNIAESFVSPLRQQAGKKLYITKHRQPDVARGMVQHLRGLQQANEVGQAGFDAYCTFVVSCDNQGHVNLWEKEPAPQPGGMDHYISFLDRLCNSYTLRFARKA